MANRSRSHSEKSTASSTSYLTGTIDMEYFWCFELSADQKSFKWMVKDEEEEEDDDFIEHIVFAKLAVLDGDAIAGEQNIVVFESDGQDGEMQKGTIVNLTKGVNPMATLNFSINGKVGGTFTLTEGSGPVTISGNHLLAFPQNEILDISKEEMIAESVVQGEDEEGNNNKSAKRKVAAAVSKQKKGNKDDSESDDEDDNEEEEEDDSDEDSDDDDDDDDDESEGEIIMKPAKKVKDTGKKAVAKPDKETWKKPIKKQKK